MNLQQKYFSIFFTFHVLLCMHNVDVESSDQEKSIESWAKTLGEELYRIGLSVTKSLEIKHGYFKMSANVEKKDPKALLAEIVENIERMMDRKMDAIRCILKVAEEEAELFEYDSTETNYTYFNSKYSKVDNYTIDYPDSIAPNSNTYLKMYLNNDTHFYNVPVNTSHSSVHVPVNIYDRHKATQIAIQWSEALNDVFVQNYKSDPALSWQYFGSASGVLRHYPAMKWKEETEEDIDVFDCRTRTWYIEAATCTKDVIILVDSSGSMVGMRKHLAAFTISNILDTFSNNDYINVMNYSTTFNYTVPCFQDMLVQATKENIATFKTAIAQLGADKKTNVTLALAEAFELLGRYREERGCSENSSACNQVIMLVTDGIAGNLSEIFDTYNRINNGSTIPVRVFTYLIGVEVTKVNEIMWAACSNRGYYAHVESLEEVQGSVLKYISVIARPLVLQSKEHPVSWTHAYADITYDDATDNVYNQKYRLLTSASVPAFDRKSNKMNNTVNADLLGVAATDVPIDDFAKLTMPYKIGVMGYAFIVSNNGYVLMHPSLRPVFNNTMIKENYNSVDFAEVEQHDDDLPPRFTNPRVLELREALVYGIEGAMFDATLKYHYDNMRRITKQVYDYYYAPLLDTPFSIGLAVHDTFGNYSIGVGDLTSKLKMMSMEGIELVSFFKGSNWKIHPKWVYCKYHYLEGHEFDTPENELIHFLEKMQDPNFKWARQYEAKKTKTNQFDIEIEDTAEIECSRKTLDDNDYYCNKDLISRLIFDANNTKSIYDNPWFPSDEIEARYNETLRLRFLGTMSGLTRWEYIHGEDDDENKTEFGDLHSRTIDETWYKSAVLQHQYDAESFAYSVPFDVGDVEDVLVTASYAIFPRDGGNEAPGSVVGYQFEHNIMRDRFLEISSISKGNALPCNEVMDCYVVDNSGYVVISYNRNHTGQFFGEIEGDLMQKMLDLKIFEKVSIYDFQGWCLNNTVDLSSDGRNLLTPLEIGKGIVHYIITNILWFFVRTNLYHLWDPNWVMADELSEITKPITLEQPIEEDGAKKKKKKKKQYYSCDLQRDLFMLNLTRVKMEKTLNQKVSNDRMFLLTPIPHSNLILIAVNHTITNSDIIYTTETRDVEYPGVIHPCQKLSLTALPRRRFNDCFNEHPLEEEITVCGRSRRNELNFSTILAFVVIIVLAQS